MRYPVIFLKLLGRPKTAYSFLIAICCLGLGEKMAMGSDEDLPADHRAAVLLDEDRELRKMAGFGIGAGLGSFVFGGSIKHDFAFLNLQYGQVLSYSWGEERRWEGRWLVMGEATIGRELSPGDAWATSLTPIARYLFGYPGNIVPFLEGGLGLTWTDIGEPDLGGDLQFNSQGGGGLYWFVRPELAYTLQYRFVHYSNAGLRRPNGGVNLHSALLGLSYFY